MTRQTQEPQDWTGHVSPGEGSWSFVWPTVAVRKFSVSDMDNNVYVVQCQATLERLLIDAADDAERIFTELDTGEPTSGDGTLAQVLTTHRHWDHHRALAEVVERTAAATLAGDADADVLPVPTGVPLAHGDRVRVGELVLEVISLRGHTPGSIALALTVPDRPTVLFTGDSLFPGGPGKTSSSEDFTSLMDDLESRVFGVYGDDTLVLPGHGDNTTLGQERPDLQTWLERGW